MPSSEVPPPAASANTIVVSPQQLMVKSRLFGRPPVFGRGPRLDFMLLHAVVDNRGCAGDAK